MRVFVVALGLTLAAGACSTSDSGSEGGQESPEGSSAGESGGSIGLGGGGETSDTEGSSNEETSPGEGSGEEAGEDAAGRGNPDFCLPKSTACVGSRVLGVCNEEGTAFDPQDCPPGQGCLAGECIDSLCTPGEKNGTCTGPKAFAVCNEAGTQFVSQNCSGAETCFLGECTDNICAPGTSICKGLSAYANCEPDGSGYGATLMCEEGQLCDFTVGRCVDACASNSKANVYVGCDYFAVDLDNIEGGAAAPVAVVVSNPAGQGRDANVKIFETATGQSLSAEMLAPVDADMQPSPSLLVASGQLKVFFLPVSASDAGSPLGGSVKKKAAYRITSDSPVTVHQFNPLNGEGVYTNDASLLLPSNLGGREYFIMSWPHRALPEAEVSLRGFATVVATEPGTTKVDVYARGKIAGGIGVPSILPNQNHSFTLQEGEVLNLTTANENGTDLTGTWIHASQKVTVFGGHECANVPQAVGYCDHLEQQLIPVNTWGSQYVADGFMARNEHQFDLWRIMAATDNVTVTTDPPIPGYEAFTLHRGAHVQFQAKGSFVVDADGPILVAHFMVGSNYPGFKSACQTGALPSGIGDPALTLAVPTQQFLKEYVVLTPPGYKENYLNIVGPAGVDVTLDGSPVTANFTPLGNTGFVIAQVPVGTGVHYIESKGQPIGVTAYGYDCDVSYAYPGGLKLEAFDL